MKLKKAMKLYPIKVNNDLGSPAYELESRSIFKSQALSPGKWMQSRTQNMTEYTEREAVAWLIDGAEKLSPIQVAMRCNKSISTSLDCLNHTLYKKGERRIWFNNTDRKWKGLQSESDFSYKKFETEEEAVAWLLCDPVNLPFSTVSMLNKSGHTIPAGAWIMESGRIPIKIGDKVDVIMYNKPYVGIVLNPYPLVVRMLPG